MAKKRSREPINIIMHPVDDRRKLVKSQGTVMLDIIEKQLGEEVLSLSMEQLKKDLGR